MRIIATTLVMLVAEAVGYAAPSHLLNPNALTTGTGFTNDVQANAVANADAIDKASTENLVATPKTEADKVEAEKKKAKECEAAKAQAERSGTAASEANVAKKCSAANYTQTAQAGTEDVPVEDTSKMDPNAKSAQTMGRLLDPNTTQIANLADGRNMKNIDIAKVHRVEMNVGDKVATRSLFNAGSLNDNGEIAGGISGAGPTKTVHTVNVNMPGRQFGPNTFVSVESNNINGLQDLSMATTGTNYNGLTTDQQGNKGWYAFNNKTKQMEFVPIDALKKGVPVGQSPSNFGGGFGDHRAAAGNLKDHAHQGNDWMQQKGSAIYSTVSGEVVQMGQGSGNVGNRIWVKTDDGQMKVMTAHMDSLNGDLKVGDKVAAGDYIGTIGNSGTQWSDPHLHIETRLTNGGSGLGTPFDPNKVIAGVYSDTSGIAGTVGVVGGNGFSTPGMGNYNVATVGNNGVSGMTGGANVLGNALQAALGGNGNGLNNLLQGGNINSLLGNVLGTQAGIGGNGDIVGTLVAGLVSQMMNGSSKNQRDDESEAYEGRESYVRASTANSARATTDGKLTGYDIVMAMKEMCANELNTAVDAATLKVSACSKVLTQ